MSISPFLKQCFVALTLCSNTIGLGCAIGFPAVLIPQLHLPDSSIKLSKGADSWIASVMTITMLIGNLMSPSMMDRLGRKMAHLILCAPAVMGWFMMVLATSVEAIILGRILHGLSLGLMLPLRSPMLGEYTSPKNRGAFLTTLSLATSFGLFLVHLLGSFFSWQETALICVFFSFASLCMTIYIPETPSWLAAKEDFVECRRVFIWLRGEEEIEELEEMVNARMLDKKEGEKKTDIKRLLTTIRKVEFYKPIIIMAHFFIIDQCAGGITMATFPTQIIGMMVGPATDVHFWMVALDVQRIISNFLAVFVINKFKRRTITLLIGILAVGIHIAIAGYVYFKVKGMLTFDATWIPITLISIQFLVLGLGTIPLPSVISGEIFPLAYRSVAGSFSWILLSVFMFTVLKTFSGLVELVGLHGTYVIYGVLIGYSVFIIMCLLPETKGKTLQQIEDEFKGRVTKSCQVENFLKIET